MIELRNVTKYFKTDESKKYLLKDVSLTLPDINIGLIGRNGTGKSTLMRMLGKIEFPNEGTIYSNNSFSWPMGLAGGVVPTMSGKANVKFVCNLYNKDPQETEEIIEYVRDFAELGEYFDLPVSTYSSGMRGRLGFGMSLPFDFDYLIIDETLATGDPVFQQKASDALKEKIGRCHIILVSHNPKTLLSMCDAGMVLNNGELNYYENIEDGIKYYREINEKEGKK